MLEACLILVLHHRLDFEGGGGGEERRGWCIPRAAMRDVSIVILVLYCPDLQVHGRSLSSWPGWAAVRVKHFLVLLVVRIVAPRFLQPTGALDQRQPGNLTAFNSL